MESGRPPDGMTNVELLAFVQETPGLMEMIKRRCQPVDWTCCWRRETLANHSGRRDRRKVGAGAEKDQDGGLYKKKLFRRDEVESGESRRLEGRVMKKQSSAVYLSK